MKNYNKDYKLSFLDNKYLTEITKQALTEYCENKDVHSTMNVTFEELLICVLLK
jgi:hypothetical protein